MSHPGSALVSPDQAGPAPACPAPPSGLPSLADRAPYHRSVAHIGRQIAQGLAYAHARGIVHRDVKPSNLLLDAAGVVWITDFGLAKAEEDGLTQTGDIVGTVRYTAPERFRGQADSRADIYSLGLTLYELLTLRPAFDSSDRIQLMERIQAAEPVHPRAIDRHVPLDLETIVLKAIEKEPARRYPDAEAMADDLRRFLDDEPIRARPVRVWERVAKWARRRPGVAAMALVVQLLLASLLVLGIWSYGRINQALAVAEDERGKALNALASESAAREAADLARAAEAKTRASSELLSADLAFKHGLELAGCGQVACGLRWMAYGLELAPDDEEGRLLRRAARANILAWSSRAIVPRAVLQAPEAIQSLALSPDGRTLVAGCDDGTIQVWELPAGRSFPPVRAHKTAILGVDFRPDGRAFLTWARQDSLVRLWDTASRTPRGVPIGSAGTKISSAGFKADRGMVLTVAEDAVRLYDGVTGERHAGPWEQVSINHARFSPDGSLLFGFGRHSALCVWNCATGQLHGEPVELGSRVRGVCFLDGGRRFATVTQTLGARSERGAGESRVSIFETATLRKIATGAPIRSNSGWVSSQSDGPVLAAGSPEGTVQRYDSTTGDPLGVPLVHGSVISWLGFSPDGRILLTSTLKGSPLIFGAASGRQLDAVAGTANREAKVCLDCDGRTLVTAEGDRVVRIWDIAGVSDAGRPLPFSSRVQTAQFSPDGRLLATASFDRSARFFDVAAGLPHGPPLEHPHEVRVARFSPDGRLLATGGDDGQISLWDVATGRRIGDPLGHPRWVVNALFSPDGKTLLVGCVEGKARLWDLTTFRPIGPLLTHPSQRKSHEI